jgi:hypothetical protein
MRLSALLAVSAALVLPAGAAAKEITALDVCGTNGCTRIDDRGVLRAFEDGGEMAAAAPAGAYRSYLVRVHMREGAGGSDREWTNRWLPAVGLLANEQGKDQFLFTPVGPTLERALRGAARGHAARAARRYARTVEPVAQVDPAVAAPTTRGAGTAGAARAPAGAAGARTAAASGGGGLPSPAWIGVAVGFLLVVGAVRARRS